MTDQKTGAEVRAQSVDSSITNTEPALARGAVISLVGAFGTILVLAGALDEEQVKVLQENAGAIALAVMTLLPILQAIWTRFSVYSPRSAAKIAVSNASSIQTVPTLDPPP